MITVIGKAILSVSFKVKLNMTEEEFDNLSVNEQNELLDETIDWMDAMRSAELEDIDVWDIEED